MTLTPLLTPRYTELCCNVSSFRRKAGIQAVLETESNANLVAGLRRHDEQVFWLALRHVNLHPQTRRRSL